jgi:phosphopantothenoylcysteine decarboxylase/phosphopantothenate--cysteine ligase
VTLIAGPTSLEPPAVREVVRVRSAAEMHDAVVQRAAAADLIVMAAAVADYSPVDRAPQKLHKSGDTIALELRKTPDILGELGRRRLAAGRGPVLVGFAAETEDVRSQAEAKRAHKHVDLIVGNDVSRHDAGFEVDTNAVIIVGEKGSETLPLMTKARVAAEILDRVERLFAEAPANTGARE